MTGSRQSDSRIHLTRSATPGCVEQGRIGRRDDRLGLVDPVDHGFGVAQVDPVERQVHARRHGAEGARLVPEVTTRRLRRAARGVEVAQRGQGQRPAARAVGQRLEHHAEVAPVLDPAHQRRRHVVEPRRLERHQQLDVGPGPRPRARGRPSGRPGRRNRAPPRPRRRAARAPGPGAASPGGWWPGAAAPAGRHAARRCTRPAPPARPAGRARTPRPGAGSAAHRPRCAARRRNGPGDRRPGPPRRGVQGARDAAPGPARSPPASGATTPCSPSQVSARLRRPSSRPVLTARRACLRARGRTRGSRRAAG